MLLGFRPAQDVLIKLKPALVFARVTQPEPGRTETEALYFDANTGELVRYSLFVDFKDNAQQGGEAERVEYDNWQLNPRLPKDTFALRLPADAHKLSDPLPAPPKPQRP